MTVVARQAEAPTRLAELEITYAQLERVLLRADAEARLTTDLEPPTAQGITRYNKTNGFLREELVPAGWHLDNSGNYCRTIHPSKGFAIVASSGDECTGVYTPGEKPSTKYRKGETTVRAVAGNVQPTLDLGERYADADPDNPIHVWYLLYRVTDDEIFAELSLPSEIEGGRIVDWAERIVLEPVPRAAQPFEDVDRDEGDEGYTVNVAMR